MKTYRFIKELDTFPKVLNGTECTAFDCIYIGNAKNVEIGDRYIASVPKEYLEEIITKEVKN